MNFKAGDKVKVIKLAPTKEFFVPTPEWDDYIPGEDNGAVSLPNAYSVEGTLIADVKIGYPIWIARDVRNGLKVDGEFQSSTVKKIYENKFYTYNSVYLIESL